MSMKFEELDEKTREYMFEECKKEQDTNPYISKLLSPQGIHEFPALIRLAIVFGNEVTLFNGLNKKELWQPLKIVGLRLVKNIPAAKRLALTEFNTWYVRGLAKRLLDEGVKECEIYRAESPTDSPGRCSQYERRIIPVRLIYDGHRAKYWPTIDQERFSIPYGPNCHHTIRRVK